MLAIRKDIGLEGQERAAAVDEIDAGQPVLEGDLLRPEVLLDRHRVVGPALDGRVVGDDDDGRALDRPDPGDDPGARGVVVVEPGRRERAQLEERRAGIEEAVDPLADGELAALAMTGDRAVVAAGAASGDGGLTVAEVRDELGHRVVVGAGLRAPGIESAPQDRHGRKDRSEPGGVGRRRRAMSRRSIVELALIAVLVTACSSVVETPSPSPTVGPPTTLVTIERHGGLCPEGECRSSIEIRSDGAVRGGASPARVPPAAVATLRLEMARANFALIKSRPFTGQCPTAYDGQETVYTFHAPSGDEAIASCTIAIDPGDPLFRAVAAALGRRRSRRRAGGSAAGVGRPERAEHRAIQPAVTSTGTGEQSATSAPHAPTPRRRSPQRVPASSPARPARSRTTRGDRSRTTDRPSARSIRTYRRLR